MQVRKIVSFVLVIFITSIAYADVPPLDRGILGKTPGDVIAVKTDPEIAAWCDFSKTIVVTSTNVLCVYAGAKPHSRTSGYGYSLLKVVKSVFSA